MRRAALGGAGRAVGPRRHLPRRARLRHHHRGPSADCTALVISCTTHGLLLLRMARALNHPARHQQVALFGPPRRTRRPPCKPFIIQHCIHGSATRRPSPLCSAPSTSYRNRAHSSLQLVGTSGQWRRKHQAARSRQLRCDAAPGGGGEGQGSVSTSTALAFRDVIVAGQRRGRVGAIRCKGYRQGHIQNHKPGDCNCRSPHPAHPQEARGRGRRCRITL